MKQKKLMILTGIAVGTVLLVLIQGTKGGRESRPSQHAVNNLNEAAVNTFNDNLRAVSARFSEEKKRNKALEARLKTLELKANQAPKSQTKLTQDTSATKALKDEISALKKMLFSIKKQQESPVSTNESKPHYTVGSSQFSKPIKYVVDVDEQLANKHSSQSEESYWHKLNKRTPRYQDFEPTMATQKQSKGIPYYTLPAGSDLSGTTLLSAIIGQVQQDSTFHQPLFPFSAIIGRGSLMAANGVPLPPEIKGMKVGGYAIGVGSFLDNISCARAYVTSALFVFQDGHFETVGQEQVKSASQAIDNNALGYLTNQYGNPCIRGTYYTNAPQVLAVMTGAKTLAGVGAGLAISQTSYSVSGGGIASAPTGSIGKIMLGNGVSEGMKEGADWLKERVKGTFDMVFVPASIPYRVGGKTYFKPNRLTLHLTKTIEINKDTKARRIFYGQNQNTITDYSLK